MSVNFTLVVLSLSHTFSLFQVEQAKQKRVFKGPVVGPMGHYIKIIPGKEEYAAVAERAMGSRNLDRFIVTNAEDRRAFQKIREQAGCKV
jgi:hypothetical protein